MNPTLSRLLTWLIALIVPFFLVMTAIRILFTPLFLQLEYRSPGFPEDTFGFTLEDRLHWSRVSLEYLLNDADLDFLAEQQLENGTPLYNERELGHMLDVKILVQQMLVAWNLLLILLLLLGVWAYFGKWMPTFLHGLGTGGKLTLGLIVLILVAVAISFQALFTGFHRIFFQGDTWLFNFSDSLIRLFPLRLWRDGFIMMGLFTIGGAALLIFLDRKFAR